MNNFQLYKINQELVFCLHFIKNSNGPFIQKEQLSFKLYHLTCQMGPQY